MLPESEARFLNLLGDSHVGLFNVHNYVSLLQQYITHELLEYRNLQRRTLPSETTY